MASWHLKDLREWTERNLSETEANEAKSLMEAIDWKLSASQYHLSEADLSFAKLLPAGETDALKATKLLFSSGGDCQEFDIASAIRGFSLVAATATIHSIPEILAQLIDLIIIREQRDVHSVSLSRITEKVQDEPLRLALKNLNASGDYRYISAFTNTIKHVNLIRPRFNITFAPEASHGIVFNRFSYKSNDYPETRDTDLISLLKRVRADCIDVGAKINSAITKPK